MKWAIVGLGNAGHGHARRIGEVGGLELAAGCDPAQEAREKFAASFHVPVHEELGPLLGDPSIEGVTVAASSLSHADLTVQALQAGKHVLVEKPFAPDAGSAERMLEAAREAGRVVAPFHNRRFDPDFLMVREVLESGRLGRVRRIHSCVGGASGPGGGRGWRGVRDLAGGHLYDWGPHLLDQVLSLASTPVVDVWGVTHVIPEWGDSDLYFRAELRFEDDLDVTVEMSGISYLRPMRWEILGDEGPLQLTGDIHGEFSMAVACKGKDTEVTETTAQAEREKRGDGGVLIYKALLDKIAGRGELAVSAEHAVLVARVMDAIRRSAEIKKGSVQL